jgi:hypothetical protein
MFGNVTSSKLRRPKVSMVYTAGMAKMKVIRPKPIETSRHSLMLYPASAKIVEL